MEQRTGNPEDNNFQSLLITRSLRALEGKVSQSKRNSDIFFTTDPPEDEAPVMPQAKPSLIDKWFPGISPSTVYLAGGAIAVAILLRSY